MFKKVLILALFIFLMLFGTLNKETKSVEYNTCATISAPKILENDIISQKNNTFSLTNITSRNTHLKNHQNNTNGTIGAVSSYDLHCWDLSLKQTLTKKLNNKSLAQNFLLTQKLTNGPPRAI